MSVLILAGVVGILACSVVHLAIMQHRTEIRIKNLSFTLAAHLTGADGIVNRIIYPDAHLRTTEEE